MKQVPYQVSSIGGHHSVTFFGSYNIIDLACIEYLSVESPSPSLAEARESN
jgi:hypothetical protein